ncbi:hypothetical protein ACE3MQ_05655 [Paenibacillus lentus]
MKKVKAIRLGAVNLSKIKLNFGVIDPQGQINGFSVDVLMSLCAVIDLQKPTFSLEMNM